MHARCVRDVLFRASISGGHRDARPERDGIFEGLGAAVAGLGQEGVCRVAEAVSGNDEVRLDSIAVLQHNVGDAMVDVLKILYDFVVVIVKIMSLRKDRIT